MNKQFLVSSLTKLLLNCFNCFEIKPLDEGKYSEAPKSELVPTFGFQGFTLNNNYNYSERCSVLFGCIFVRISKTSEIRTNLFGFQTPFYVRNPNEHMFERSDFGHFY